MAANNPEIRCAQFQEYILEKTLQPRDGGHQKKYIKSANPISSNNAKIRQAISPRRLPRIAASIAHTQPPSNATDHSTLIVSEPRISYFQSKNKRPNHVRNPITESVIAPFSDKNQFLIALL